MCLSKWIKRWRRRRRDRIYEGPDIDGGTRIRNDTDAPKEIISRELVQFCCRFSTLSFMEEDTNLKCGVYSFSATKGERGVACTVTCTNPSVVDGEQKYMRPENFLAKIDAILHKYNAAEYNGRYYKVSGLPNFFGSSIGAEYESGETLNCYNNQDPFLPIEMMVELCRLFGVAEESCAT